MSAPNSSAAKGAADRVRAEPAEDRGRAARACLAGWIVPGAGHLLLGDVRRGTIFFGVLILMYVCGLAFGGRLFPFQMSEPLVFLAALSEWALLAPRLFAGMAGFGQGEVVSITYEYGNTFLIVGGLLNALVILDSWDRALGRRPR